MTDEDDAGFVATHREEEISERGDKKAKASGSRDMGGWLNGKAGQYSKAERFDE